MPDGREKVPDHALGPLLRSIHVASLELSAREATVLALYSHGLRRPEIAEALGLSPNTVMSHAAKARIKLGAKTTCQAACEAIRQEIIP